jgi:thiamine biosynthesis lipoprotein
MNWFSNTEIRRCRPLLGTFVEITASGLEQDGLQVAVNSAFGAIERIQTLLSAHDPDSELSRLNREALLRPVRVCSITLAVLRRALQLAFESAGAFDPTVAPMLARWGLLPAELRRKSPGNWRDVLILRNRNVRFLRPLALDLGGIAKGFAVDTAIKDLKRSGVKSAVVNAGGDLRSFGEHSATIFLRHPARPQLLADTLELRDCALATSSPCFTQKQWKGKIVSHLVNPIVLRAVIGATSVSVCAKECWLADALTKVVLAAPHRAQKLLAKYGAEAFVLTA